MARIVAWKHDVELTVAGCGDFTLHCRRLSVADRDGLRVVGEEFDKAAGESVPDPAGIPEAGRLLGLMVESVSGIEFEFGPDDVVAPTSVEGLMKCFERDEDAVTYWNRWWEVWWEAAKANRLSGVTRFISGSQRDSSTSSTTERSKETSGATPPTAGPAGSGGSAAGADA